MFFTYKNFMSITGDAESAKLCAQAANNIINQEGTVLYGNLLEDGTADNFTSTQSNINTHVSLAIGMSEMGLFDGVRTKGVHIEKPDNDEMATILKQQVEMLRAEMRQLRGKDNG